MWVNIFTEKAIPTRRGAMRLLDGLRLQHLLHDLLLLDQEGANDPRAHAASAFRAAVRARHRLLALADARVLNRAQSRDLPGTQRGAAVVSACVRNSSRCRRRVAAAAGGDRCRSSRRGRWMMSRFPAP